MPDTDIELEEIELALKQMKNNIVGGEDNLPEKLKESNDLTKQKRRKLFSSCLHEGLIPTSCETSNTILLYRNESSLISKTTDQLVCYPRCIKYL